MSNEVAVERRDTGHASFDFGTKRTGCASGNRVLGGASPLPTIKAEGAQAVVVSAAIEAEISLMAEADRAEFLSSLGLEDSGLDRIIRAGYTLLGLITYFTVGPKEARAWTIL